MPATYRHLFRSQIIEALKQREDDQGLIVLSPRPNFTVGDKIRILDGSFADCIGLFEGMRDWQRVSVLLDLLGRKVRVLLEGDAIAAA